MCSSDLEALRITGADLLQLEVIDTVLKEPAGGNHWAPLQAAETLKAALLSHLSALQALPERQLLEQRYQKFRRMGRFLEGEAPQSLAAS